MNTILLGSDILNPRKVRDAVCQVLNRYWPDAEVRACVYFFQLSRKYLKVHQFVINQELDPILTGVHGGEED